jgi:tetratricopeptide (TPR) repeat protein
MFSLAFLAIGRAAPSVAHGLRERLHFLPSEVRTGAILLTMFIPFLLVFTLPPSSALFWGLVLGTVGTWSILNRRERQTCVAAALCILVSPFALTAWTRVAQGAFPDSYMQALWAGQLGAESRETNLEALPKPDATSHDPDYFATLALLDRRAGRYDAALKNLERAVSLEPGGWAYRNNLGNIRLLRGDTDGALEAYAAAQSLAPGQPLVRLNQAQAWVGKMDFTQADNALTEAVRMGYRLPQLLTSDPHDVIVRDRTLAPRHFWERLLRDQPPAGSLSWTDALRMSWAPVLPMRPFWLTIPLWFALYYVALARTLPRVQSCSGCGAKVCRKCHYRVQRRSLCPQCYAIRREIQAPLKRQELMAARRRRRSQGERAVALLVATVVPGAGFYLRRSYRAAFVAALCTSVLVLIATAGITWPDPVATLGRASWNQRATLPLLLIAALSILSARAYLRRTLPEDDTMMPSSELLRPARET